MKDFLRERGEPFRLPSEQDFSTIKAVSKQDAPPNLSLIYVPTLAIYGSDDSLVDIAESISAYQKNFKESGNSNLTIKVFNGAAHDLSVNGQISKVYIEFTANWLESLNGFGSEEKKHDEP